MSSIAFFDSGVGGLTVLAAAMDVLQSEHFVYYADRDHVPYGTKSDVEIHALVNSALTYLNNSYDLKALVLACNTATSVSVSDLRSSYSFPIIGMEPALKPAHEQIDAAKRVMVCATELTLKLDKLNQLIDDLDVAQSTDFLSLQPLVSYAEQGQFYSNEVIKYLCDVLEPIDWTQYGALVLGCTHFGYYRSLMESILPAHVSIVDGNRGTVKNLCNQIDKCQTSPIERLDYFESGRWVESGTLEPYWQQINYNSDQKLKNEA